MKERPILFSGPMVRAILEGRKTQTRRLMVPQIGDTTLKTLVNNDGDMEIRYLDPSKMDGVRWEVFVKGKYGKPGDRLWVRETWGPCDGGAYYRASESPTVVPNGGKWKPSIHMPRWASRITLEIESVRVERLNAISEEDAIAEGVPPAIRPPQADEWDRRGLTWLPYTTEFRGGWEDINGGGSWDLNPWVWVITFKRVEAK